MSKHGWLIFVMLCPGTVSFETLSEAFGPSSLGIIVVKDLPPKFKDLRAQVLSNASYLAALPEEELGKIKIKLIPWLSSRISFFFFMSLIRVNYLTNHHPQNPSPAQNPNTSSAGPVGKKPSDPATSTP